MPNCLCLDGGGIRGIVQVSFLHELLLDIRRKSPSSTLNDIFDVVGGVSIGAVVAAAVREKPDLFERDIIEIIQDFSNCIGNPSSLLGWLGGRHSQRTSKQQLTTLIEQYIGNCDFYNVDRKTRIIVPVYNTTTQSVEIFDSAVVDSFLSIKDVLLATTAHPQLVGAHRIQNHLYLDGGIARNNPILLVACILPTTYKFLSIGTGEKLVVADSKNAEQWTGFKWFANGLSDFICDSYTDDFISNKILGERILRFNIRSTRVSDATDKSESHTTFLVNLGKGWYWSNKAKIWAHLNIDAALSEQRA